MPFLQCLLKIKYTRKTPGWRRATAMLTIAVSVRRGNFGKFVLSRFHVRFSKQLTLIAPVTSNGKNGRVLCNKTFSVRKYRISARIPDCSGMFLSLTWAISCRFRKSKLYKNLLRIGGGDSK